MAQLAIKGHTTKGEKVIEILGKLGGSNAFGHMGNNPSAIYYIDETNKNFIICAEAKKDCDCIVFSLEEFLEKYPYKIGDKVLRKPYVGARQICEIRWDSDDNCIKYGIGVGEWFNVSQIQPYKEETMEEQNEKSVNHVYENEIISFDIAQKDKYELDLQGKFEVKLRDGKYFVERIKPQYPKTYEECCEILMGKNTFHDFALVLTNLSIGKNGEDIFALELPHIDTINSLCKLLICRDAYWKIAGEQMGLGKSWKPDWNHNTEKYVIYPYQYLYSIDKENYRNTILAFPTREMRDAFYENFEELINDCKELL